MNFNTKLSPGNKAFIVSGSLDFCVREVTVGQVRVEATHPSEASEYHPVFKEEYMVFETGVGSGSIWTIGKNIFVTREEAEKGVIAHQQMAYFERRERDKNLKEMRQRRESEERRQLAELKAKYEAEAANAVSA